MADTMVVGMSHPQDVAIGSSHDTERTLRQFVSGNVFGVFGLTPASGRLIGGSDDVVGAHPVAVLSYDFWTRRFRRDTGAVGTVLRFGDRAFEIIGIAPKDFIGTEPGLVPDVFIPSAANTEALNSPGWEWFLMWVRPRPGVGSEQIRQVLQADFDREHQARLKGFSSDTPRNTIEAFLSERIALRPAGHGASPIKKHLGGPLMILMALVGLVLVMACATVGNLLTGQALSRSREMALRVSIGAGRLRLMQLVLVESAMLALAASALGAIVAWWAAPAVMSMIEPIEIPVRLVLNFDWRLAAFGAGVAVFVTALFGFAPALRASSVAPVTALKGTDARQSRRVIKSLLVVQMTFCAFVLFAAGLFHATFDRLSSQSFGLSYDHVLTVEADARNDEQRAMHWLEVMREARRLPGVESAAVAGWPLLSQNGWTMTVRGGAVEPRPEHFLGISQGFFSTLHIDLLEGRDFRSGDVAPRLDASNQPVAGVGIVNAAFAQRYFGGRSPIGQRIAVRQAKDVDAPLDIIGMVSDTAYREVRETMHPIVFVPYGAIGSGILLVKTAGDPLALGPTLTRMFQREWPDARLRQLRAARDYIDTQMVVERLLARLTAAFATLALLLAAIGLYGVVNDAVIQRRREIGLRMALGAQARDIVRHVTVGSLVLVGIGLCAGLGAGIAFGRVIGSLLFQVTSTDVSALAPPLLILATVFALASLPPSIRAVRTDPTETLRTD
jgi:predicted permease